MMKNKIIAFAGRKRSGKTELSNFLKDEYGAVVITIASYLKELCASILSCDMNHLLKIKDDGTTFEMKVDDRWVNLLSEKTNIPKNLVWKEIGDITFTNVRQMLQVIGTDLIRKYNPNWHVEQMIKEIKSYGDNKLITIDDVRFLNEKQAIEQLGGKVFFIIRTSNCLNVSNHISENSLHWYDFNDNDIIINNSNVELLTNKIQMWFNDMTNGVADKDALLIPQYDRELGFENSEVVKTIVEHIKNNEMFDKKGLIDVNIDGIKYYIENNPYIIENLKQWL